MYLYFRNSRVIYYYFDVSNWNMEKKIVKVSLYVLLNIVVYQKSYRFFNSYKVFCKIGI